MKANKNIIKRVRVTKKEEKKLEARAKKAGLTVSAYIRMKAIYD